jgi:beta-1,4-N-acetylglucosaminyltransferase
VIFVTVGTHTDPFDRLLIAMDQLTPSLGEDVIMQCGVSKYVPTNAAHFDFLANDKDVIKLYRDSNIVVCHAGAGSIITALSYGKHVVAVPRLLRFKEHIDDQQIELASKLEDEGYLLSVMDIDNLYKTIQTARNMPLKPLPNEFGLATHLKQFLSGLV